ncbi:hypothetical protein N0V90_001794 [Kalmusia sp. IMI 367209]|nr:hypothetical protein N0V90_001794 [Kalmusia sp. IMI 367209]
MSHLHLRCSTHLTFTDDWWLLQAYASIPTFFLNPLSGSAPTTTTRFRKGVKQYEMGIQGAEPEASEASMSSVKEWLEGLAIKGGQGEGDETEKQTKAGPFTPPQKRKNLERYEGISPTDTNFSGDAVFDSPLSACSLGSPCTPGQEHYAETNASSLEDGEDEDKDKTFIQKELLINLNLHNDGGIEPELARSRSKDGTIQPEDSPFATKFAALDLEQDSTPLVDLDPQVPRLIWITSCLQCVLADLPCSRTIPACSRCTRKGNGAVCLLYRRRLRAEMYDENGNVDMTPVLLKVAADDEVVWEEKVGLSCESIECKQLLTSWFDTQDRKNWVLPANDGIIGDFKTRPFKIPKVHPGEGRGRATYYEMRLASI